MATLKIEERKREQLSLPTSGKEEVEKMKNIQTAEKGYIQILPGEYGTDGFFIAKFRRKQR